MVNRGSELPGRFPSRLRGPCEYGLRETEDKQAVLFYGRLNMKLKVSNQILTSQMSSCLRVNEAEVMKALGASHASVARDFGS